MSEVTPSPHPRTVLLLDGHSLAYRAFYALPADLRTTTGQITNAVYGFTSMLIKALQDYKTRHIAVAFDRGAPVERMAIRPEYKAQREAAPDEFRQQMGLIKEVLDVLKVRAFEIDNVEADDILHVLGTSIAAEGHNVVLVTADRDFFQMVGPRIKLMMNRRGISETVVYDEAGVRQRFGFGPEKYLDYAALRGDPSDNIAGVPGVGEKTAAKLVVNHGSLEGIFEHLEEQPPKLRTSLGDPETQKRLLENREFFRLRSIDELPEAQGLAVRVDDLEMGEWNREGLRRLFDALEFRTLYERLLEGDEKPEEAPALQAEVRIASSKKDLATLLRSLEGAGEIVALVAGDAATPRRAPYAIAVFAEGVAWVVPCGNGVPGPLRELLGTSNLVTHGAKDALLRLGTAGIESVHVALDTEIAAYLLDPSRGSYPLEDLAATWLGSQLDSEAKPGAAGQQELALEGESDADHALGVAATAVARLAEVLRRELQAREGSELMVELELPLAAVLAKVERAGIRVNVDYLAEISRNVGAEMRVIEEEIYSHAGGPFNINSPPQLRTVLYERLGLKPSRRTKTGYSTDAQVLEGLREEHPIVDGILRFREKSKLKSTYLDALPPLVDPETRRVHCRFNQTVAATGRLSSDSPNLQNIPIRTEEGRQIRRAFVPDPGNLLLKADYSQVEFRVLAHLSEDPEMIATFERGEDLHRRSIAGALGLDESEVDAELRNVGKMVSYGVTYGMGAFGLSQRLHIPMDQARTYIEGFFQLFPRVREYLDEVVARATDEGYTTTMFGRRRYLPELRSRNPRLRGLGERMALNAPIQGTAADILKAAMVKTDPVLTDGERMILTVHDELVFEVPERNAEDAAERVRDAMESAASLKVPLVVDVGWGPNWADIKSSEKGRRRSSVRSLDEDIYG